MFGELHTWRSRDLYDVIETSMAAREQPLLIIFTTAGWDRNSFCYEMHSHALRVLENPEEDEEFLPVLYGATLQDDWEDPAVWAKANPSYGVTVNPSYLESQAKKARRSVAYENSFKRLHLNIWTEAAVRWLPMDKYDACNEPVDVAALLGKPCYGGLDLASTTDVAALALLFPDTLSAGKGYRVLLFLWIPEEGARQRAKRDRAPYLEWQRRRLIELTPGDVIDYEIIRSRVNALAKRFKIQEIAYDPWNATQLALQLQGDGLNLIEFRQGFRSLSEPAKELEALIRSGRLAHGGNPALRWMASNTTVMTDPAGNIKPDKQKSTEKIDGIVAVVMALGRAMRRPEHSSVYSRRGLLSV